MCHFKSGVYKVRPADQHPARHKANTYGPRQTCWPAGRTFLVLGSSRSSSSSSSSSIDIKSNAFDVATSCCQGASARVDGNGHGEQRHFGGGQQLGVGARQHRISAFISTQVALSGSYQSIPLFFS